MQRLKVFAIIVLALVLSTELALHNHSLIPESSGSAAAASLCPVCVFGADRVTVSTPPATLLVLLGLVLVVVEISTRPLAALPAIPSRAPPALV